MTTDMTRRQLTLDEVDVVIDHCYAAARRALGIADDVTITRDQWNDAAHHIKRALTLTPKEADTPTDTPVPATTKARRKKGATTA